MSRSAAERINRKDTVIRQNNAELEELRSQYENLDICEEDKQVIDDYIACKDARADRMAEKLYEKGRKDVKKCIRIRKLIRRCMILSAIVTVVLIQYNKNEKLRESLEICGEAYCSEYVQQPEIQNLFQLSYGLY